jgi:hypothetical protein
MTGADRALAAALVLASFAPWFAGGRAVPSEAIVEVGRTPVARIPLAEDARIPVAGALGPVEVEVRHGAVRVVRSGCPGQVCVSMGWKRRSGDLIACVPNGVIVRLSGGTPDPDAPDAVTE